MQPVFEPIISKENQTWLHREVQRITHKSFRSDKGFVCFSKNRSNSENKWEFKVWKDTKKYDIRPDHVQKYMHICQMHTIESLSFMTQTKECKFHIDSNAVCERGPASKIWIISFFDSDIQPGYKLSMKQANGRVELFRISSGSAYALTGPARDAEHKFETTVKKYTIRVGGQTLL